MAIRRHHQFEEPLLHRESQARIQPRPISKSTCGINKSRFLKKSYDQLKIQTNKKILPILSISTMLRKSRLKLTKVVYYAQSHYLVVIQNKTSKGKNLSSKLINRSNYWKYTKGLLIIYFKELQKCSIMYSDLYHSNVCYSSLNKFQHLVMKSMNLKKIDKCIYLYSLTRKILKNLW